MFAGACYPDDVPYSVSNCTAYLQIRRYHMQVTAEESAFPIAFSIMLYQNTCQFERLLMALWRPSNVYCIHVDASSPSAVQHTVHCRVECSDL